MANKIKTSKSDGVNYHGNVTIKITKGNKVCSVRKIKNNGRWPLFHYVDLCLAGRYTEAEAYRPMYLMLYAGGAIGSNIPALDATTFNTMFSTGRRCAQMAYQTAPLDLAVVGNMEAGDSGINGRATATLKFEIPGYTLIDPTTLDPNIGNNLRINALALFGKNMTTSDPNNISAYILIEDPAHKGQWGNLLQTTETQVADAPKMVSDSYTLWISWEMELLNPTSQTAA